MPTYEYKCSSCNNKFELVQKMIDKPKAKCPKCRKEAKRLFSVGSGFIFKGSGFYTTDYRSDNYKKREKEEKGGKPSKCDGCPKKEDKSCSS